LPFDVSNLAQGRNLRVVHLLRELNGRCELACVAPDERLAEAAGSVLSGVRVTAAEKHPAQVTVGGSYWVRRALGFIGYDPALLAEMSRMSARADVVLGFDLPSAVYLLAASGQARRRSPGNRERPDGPRTVCDVIDDPWLSWRSFPRRLRCSAAGLKVGICTRVIRRRVLSTFDALVAVAPRDAAALSRAAGRRVTVVPNGVDVIGEGIGPGEREPMAVFTGTMHFPPNEAAACYLVRRIWPRVRRRFHECVNGRGAAPATSGVACAPKLAIVGAHPTPRVRRLAEHPGVTVTGYVDDVSAWLKRARVAVVPMVNGCGMKNKVLEAWAAGCPVVSTRLGAANLPTGADSGLIVAETTGRIAREVAGLRADPSAARAMGAAGRAAARERFSWSKSAAALLGVLRGEAPATLPTTGKSKPDTREGRRPSPGTDHGLPYDEEALIRAPAS